MKTEKEIREKLDRLHKVDIKDRDVALKVLGSIAILEWVLEYKTQTCKECSHYYTDYDCLNDFCSLSRPEVSKNNGCELWEKMQGKV